ncbi:MAG: hypothetical protein HZA53_00765 [Planctomycetes bacterium]|nr:hypothetical protein [Planctomycetota bacterium]
MQRFVLLLTLTLLTALRATPAAAQTTFSSVHPIFQAKCGACHVNGGAGGFNIGHPNPNSAYMQSQQPSYYSPGNTKAYASLVRILDGTMPLGAGCTGDPNQDAGNAACLTASEEALITAWINDGQLPPIVPSATLFCPGDGSVAPCPCGNSGATGNGCANSVFAAGGALASAGTPRVSTDNVVLTATNLSGTTCVFFQGDAQQPPAIVDDGLGCVTGSIVRLGTHFLSGGTGTYPEAGDATLSVRGAVPTVGGTRYYQCFYRNASLTFCPPSTSNRTNGVRLVWAP